MKRIPTKSILSPSFRYTPAVATDIRRTFRRVDPTWGRRRRRKGGKA